MLGKINKALLGATLASWAIGVGIALYVGISILVFDKDFGGRGNPYGKGK